MLRRSFVARILLIGCVVATSALITNTGAAQSDTKQKIKFAMATLKDKTAKLGAPRIDGSEPTGSKDWPVLYFGTTKMNNSTQMVDEVVKEHGGIATVLVHVDLPPASSRFVRVSTTESGARAVGTTLAPDSGAILALRQGDSVYPAFPTEIGGRMHYMGYEPIKDASGKVIGAYSVGVE